MQLTLEAGLYNIRRWSAVRNFASNTLRKRIYAMLRSILTHRHIILVNETGMLPNGIDFIINMKNLTLRSLFIYLSLCRATLACDQQSIDKLYFEKISASSITAYQIYIPNKAGNAYLAQAEIKLERDGVTYFGTYLNLHSPSKYEKSPWFEDFQSAIIKTEVDFFNSLTIEAYYQFEKSGVPSKCIATVKYSLDQSQQLDRKALN